MLSSLELNLLRAWLVFLAIFELPNIYGYLYGKLSLSSGFFSTLKDSPAEKRLWSFLLLLLVFPRIQAAVWPTSPGVLALNAAVHVSEMLVFGNEMQRHKSKGGKTIFYVICANAIWFTSAAIRV